MSCLAALAALAAPGASAQVLSQTKVTSVGGANALSTPAARHLVRMDSGTYLLALQRDRALPDTGLQLYRSDDDGFSWTRYAAMNPSAAERQTADMLKVGGDVAVVTSFDAPSIVPDPALDPGRKVYFQWWRTDGVRDWSGQPRVTVFNPNSGAAYHRGELAIDSQGRIWVQAFKRGTSSCDPVTDPKCAVCAEVANGDNYGNQLVVSVRTDDGRTFGPEQSLATTLCRAGGRLISVGTKLLLIWNDYSANEHGTRILTRFVQRDAADALGVWSAAKDAFPDEPADGIYHGAALSAVADSSGVHLVYKDQNKLKLWYRRFDVTTGTFGPRVQVDDSQQDWALQPATTLRNGELFIAANHLLAQGKYETRIWRQSTGLGVANAVALPSEDAFHGYPALPETLPGFARSVPYVYTSAPAPSGSGDEISVRIEVDQPVALLSLESGRAMLPAGKSVAVRVQTAPVPGLTDPLRLDVSGLPAGVHGDFAPPQIAAAQEATLTLSADPGTPSGSSNCAIGFTAGTDGWKMPFRLDVVAAPAVSLRGAQPGAVLAGVARMKVAEVRLLVDGAPVATSAGSPASFSWDTAGVADGSHDLSGMAVDEIGNSASTAPVRVGVRNGSAGSGGGGCASAAADQPLIALAVGLLTLPRRRRRDGGFSSSCLAA
jgi:hypothetical protein